MGNIDRGEKLDAVGRSEYRRPVVCVISLGGSMRDASSVRQVSLKSKLLFGAVGLSAAAMSSAALADPAPAAAAATPPADPPKWSPYAEVGVGLGSGYTAGDVDIVAPVWQNLNSLLFVQVD